MTLSFVVWAQESQHAVDGRYANFIDVTVQTCSYNQYALVGQVWSQPRIVAEASKNNDQVFMQKSLDRAKQTLEAKHQAQGAAAALRAIGFEAVVMYGGGIGND